MTTSKTLRTAEIAAARKVDAEVSRLWTLFHDVNDKAIVLEREANKSEKYLGQYSAGMRERKVAIIADKRAAAAAIREEARPLRDAAVAYDTENYKGWNRFFLVQHIHNTQHCSSFRPTTRVGWLPDVSGLTEAEAVAAHGETLCTICFPSAPTELTTKKVDETKCGGYPDRDQPSRRGYYSGNWATCTDCGQRVTLTSTGKLRTHKK